jgi:hypothetical protein
MRWTALLLWIGLWCMTSADAQGIIDVCPPNAIRERGATFEPGGIILTAFDSSSLWVYDIERDTRYPLPQTAPCTFNCNVSPDFQWITFLNPETFQMNKMRFSGIQRTPIARDASEVQWWSADTLLVWTPDHRAYLRPDGDMGASPRHLPVAGVRAVQPRGLWALAVRQHQGDFYRYLVNLEALADDALSAVRLAPDDDYFNAATWSPDGAYLAYVGRSAYDETAGIAGSEIFLAQPNSAIPQQMTFLFNVFGAVRINGYTPELSWSPDGTKIAFWGIDLNGANPTTDTGGGSIFVLDVTTRDIRHYCGFVTTDHTPTTPRLVWSPDSTHIAFAGNVENDDKPVLLLALDIETGVMTELSNGMFPAPNIPDVTAWGYRP